MPIILRDLEVMLLKMGQFKLTAAGLSVTQFLNNNDFATTFTGCREKCPKKIFNQAEFPSFSNLWLQSEWRRQSNRYELHVFVLKNTYEVAN